MNSYLTEVISTQGLTALLKEVKQAYEIYSKDDVLYETKEEFRELMQKDLDALDDCIFKTSSKLKDLRGGK